MRTLKFAFAVATSLSLQGLNPAPLKPYFGTDYVVGPFDGSKDVEMVLKVEGAKPDTLFEITYSYLENDKIYAYESFKKEDVSEVSDFNLNYILNVKDRMTNSGIKVNFKATSTTPRKIVKQCTVNIFPTLNDVINGFDYKYKNYEISNRTFKLSENNVIGNIETLSFKNTVDSLQLNNDNSLRLDEITFEYNFIEEIKDKANGKFLRIKDKNNYLKYISKDENGYCYLPLCLVQNEKDIHIDFNREVYVDPNTLDMSFTYRTGFVKCYKYYFNPDIFRKFHDEDFCFVLNKVGFNNLTVELPMKLLIDKKTIGMCHDSLYCISGGIKE